MHGLGLIHIYNKEIRMTTQKEIMRDIYDAAILTVGAVAISFVSKKLTKDSLGVPMTVMGASKLALAFGLSAVGVKILEDKKLLPDNPFKVTPSST